MHIKLLLAMDLLNVIIKMAEQEKDYSLILRNYNELIEEYNLPLFKIKWITIDKFKFIIELK